MDLFSIRDNAYFPQEKILAHLRIIPKSDDRIILVYVIFSF